MPPAKAPTLSELQAAFQRAILDGDDAVLARIRDNSRTDRGVLFGVYRHAYASRLVEVLRNDHPLVAAYLGDAAFDAIARAYVRARPSRSQNARWFSQGFPEFLQHGEAACPEVAELATLERMVNDAFDAADAPTLSLTELGQIPPDSWEALTFVPHTSVSCAELTTNAYASWVALKDGTAAPLAAKLQEAEIVIAWRRDLTPALRRMPAEEAMMWSEAAKGVRFGGLCELVAIFAGSDEASLRAAQYLQGWITAGLLSGVAIAL